MGLFKFKGKKHNKGDKSIASATGDKISSVKQDTTSIVQGSLQNLTMTTLPKMEYAR